MTDREAFELVVKYAGGEDGLLMISEMIKEVGIDKTVQNMAMAYENNGIKMSPDFLDWMKQGFRYMQERNKLN